MNKTFSEILKVGCSGLVGIFVTIGYQHFFSQPQNQQQEQMQNQSITVNINGQEVSYQSDDVIYLNNRISELEAENISLKSHNETLEKTNSNLERDLKQYIKELENSDVFNLKKFQLMKNGLKQELTNSTVIFYNNNPFFSLETLIDVYPDPISFDNNTLILTLGEKVPQKDFLFDVCPPYQTDKHYKFSDYMYMCGETYKNGFQTNWDEGFLYFNLNGKYNKLEFDLGHIDGGYMEDGILEIYLDGQFSEKHDLVSSDLVKHCVCELNGANQMQLIWKSNKFNTVINFGIANITVE